MQYFVHSVDGQDYRVGLWVDGEWIPGSREDALRELVSLNEGVGSYVFGVEKRARFSAQGDRTLLS